MKCNAQNDFIPYDRYLFLKIIYLEKIVIFKIFLRYGEYFPSFGFRKKMEYFRDVFGAGSEKPRMT